MDVTTITSALKLVKEAIISVKGVIGLLPNDSECKAAEKQLQEIERTLQIAEEQVARELGYQQSKCSKPVDNDIDDLLAEADFDNLERMRRAFKDLSQAAFNNALSAAYERIEAEKDAAALAMTMAWVNVGIVAASAVVGGGAGAAAAAPHAGQTTGQTWSHGAMQGVQTGVQAGSAVGQAATAIATYVSESSGLQSIADK